MFVHLRTHTEFSVVDGTNRIPNIVALAIKNAQPALAITDLNNLFGTIKFYREARNKGIKPLIGAEIVVAALTSDVEKTSRIILLVQNQKGYLNLSELLTRAWTQSANKAQAQCQWDWLQELNEGLIVLSGAQAGPIGQVLLQNNPQEADAIALKFSHTFKDRFYIELQRAGREDDEAHVISAVQLAARLQLPVVATHPVQFEAEEDYDAHEARVCIAEGEILADRRRIRRFTREQYFKSSQEMQALFSDVPSALQNTTVIAQRCNLSLQLGKPQLPAYPIPAVDGSVMSPDAYFRYSSYEGLKERLNFLYPEASERAQQRPRYEDRLEFEIETILAMGFPGYFLIVSDFINWAKNNGCPVGPGRGSGAGSLVAYCLKITDLDPLQYSLLFERFLNPERVSMPDFDIDFCQSNRDRVIDYVKDKYGKDAVSQIATFGTMAARAAIRDVGRVLDMSYMFCDGISKLIPNKPGTSVTLQYPPETKKEGDKNNYAIEMEPVLAERIRQEDDVRILIELAQKLEGLTRNIGMHAGGVLIAPGKLTDFCPLYQQVGSDSAVSQFDKDDVEAAGLVKFDFLGLATLTILEIAKALIVKRHAAHKNFTFESIPLDDAATYSLFSDGKTEAVFQFESSGMQRMLRDAKPTRLEDLIALNALYRPGPMDLIPSFIARKHGREQVEYPHPLVEPVLSETYGIMVYQEQVMQTAQILGGYSLGGADMLRRAMGKKKAEEMAEHRSIFREGAAKKQITETQADEIFDLMEKFAGYGFNKSHAAAYSLLAYQTGWLKVHFAAEFFCANMTVEMDDTDKLRILFDDALKMGLHFEPPDVNRSFYRFEPVTNTLIRYGLGAIKGTGQQAIEAIIAARESGGPFTSLFDFCVRVDRTKLNKRTLEALIKAGAFDRLEGNRAALFASVERAMAFGLAAIEHANQVGLFDMMGDDTHGSSTQEPELVSMPVWGVRECLMFEKSALGFYLSGHLFDEDAAEVRRFAPRPLAQLTESREPAIYAGIVSDLRVINGQRGKVTLFKLDDKSFAIEATLDEALAQSVRHILKEDALIVVSAKVQNDRFSGGLRLNIQKVMDLSIARCRFGKYLRVNLQEERPDIAAVLANFPAQKEINEQETIGHGILVRLALECATQQGAVSAELQLGAQAKIFPDTDALQALSATVGGGRVEVVY